jgi:hypothetical protein
MPIMIIRGGTNMKNLPILDLEKIPLKVNDLPEGHYLVYLVKVSEVYVKRLNRPCLVWCWEIQDEIDGTLLEGKRVLSLSGTKFDVIHCPGSPARITLIRHLAAFGVIGSPKLRVSKLQYQSITLDIEDDSCPTVRMIPEWYYGMSLICKSDAWIIPYLQDT